MGIRTWRRGNGNEASDWLSECSSFCMRPDSLFFFLLLLVCATAQAGDVCNPTNLAGPYAFQLWGSTAISGTSKPAASLGRITFDGSGGVSGTASAAFSGVLLGNPVTGTYEAKPDCSVTWKLQDDSGGFQNFSGTFSADGTRVQFLQTDRGGVQNGIMVKTSDSCSAADLQKKYKFTVSGSSTPMQPGEVPQTISAKGTLDVAANGTFQVDSDCSVHFVLTLPQAVSPMNMRGFLVNAGKEILAFETDPGAMVAARFRSDSK